MGEIITIANQKGGVGKTTTVVNLAYSLSHYKVKVLIIDLDPQSNATSGFGFSVKDTDFTIYNVLLGDCPIEKAIYPLEASKNIDIVPSNIHLAGVSVSLLNTKKREFKLKENLKNIKDKYDFILIDTPPSLGILTINALSASDSFLIPVQCEYYALEGLTQLLKTIKIVQNKFNPGLKLKGVVLTMHDPRTNLSKQVVDEVKKYFKDYVYKSIIPRNIALSEAPSYGKPCYLYDSKSTGAISYLKLAKEMLGV